MTKKSTTTAAASPPATETQPRKQLTLEQIKNRSDARVQAVAEKSTLIKALKSNQILNPKVWETLPPESILAIRKLLDKAAKAAITSRVQKLEKELETAKLEAAEELKKLETK